MSEIFKLFSISWRDFLTRKFIILSIFPIICSVLTLGVGLFFIGNEFGEILYNALNSGDFGLFDLSCYPFIMSVIKHKMFFWIISATFYAIGTYFMLMFSIIMALFIAGFLTPIVANEINARHYNISFEPISAMHSLKLVCIVILKFFVILLICLPFMFVPFLNFIAINIPFFYIYLKLLLIDIGSNTLTKQRFEIAWLENGGFKFMFFTFIFYIVSLVPILGLLFQLFFIIFLSHIFFRK